MWQNVYARVLDARKGYKMKIKDFRIVNHGVERSDYFQGHGVSFTRFTDCATGIGHSEKEALEDALDQLASSGFDVEALESTEEFQAAAKECLDIERDLPEDCWFHVSVDVVRASPRIRLDNQDKEDGSVLVIAEDAAEAEHDQSIDGSSWEIDGDFAYTYIQDRPGLVAALEADGYAVDASEYYENSEEEFAEMWAKLSGE